MRRALVIAIVATTACACGGRVDSPGAAPDDATLEVDEADTVPGPRVNDGAHEARDDGDAPDITHDTHVADSEPAADADACPLPDGWNPPSVCTPGPYSDGSTCTPCAGCTSPRYRLCLLGCCITNVP